MTDQIKLDLDAIEAAARAATPGPWEHANSDLKGGVVYGGPIQHWVNGSGKSQIFMACGAEWMTLGETDSNARFVATTNPAVVLEMIRRIRVLEQMAGESMLSAGWIRAPLEVPEVYEVPAPKEVVCQECDDDLCKGTGIYDGRKCDGIPF